MEFEIKIVRGPLVEGLAKEAAAEQLQGLPAFPENAQYEIDEVDGRYVAAVVIPKTAAPFPPAADEEPSGPPSGDSGEDQSDFTDGEDKPAEEKPKEDKEGPSSEGAPKEEGKMSMEHQLANLTDMLTKITDALGLSTPADGMIPGADEGAMGGPPGPPGAEGTHGDPAMGKEPGVGSDNKMHTVHERSLKPGEAPPGTTPVGAPAFASVQVDNDHPWKDAIESNVREFEVESEVGDAPMSTVAAELKSLAEPYGYIVTDLAPSGSGTSRVASARIVRTR